MDINRHADLHLGVGMLHRLLTNAPGGCISGMDPTGPLRQDINGFIFGSMKQRHDDPQFKFRIPAEMKLRLERLAKEHGRTLTAEIIQRLEWTLDNHRYILHGPDGPEPGGPEEALEAISNAESLIKHEQEVLREMESSSYQTTLSPREMAGAIALQKNIIIHQQAMLSTLKKNIVEEKVRTLIAEADKEWDLQYPDGNGPPSPWDLAVAEWDKKNGGGESR